METLWNVNDIFSMTFYTYDKIREVGWKNWDSAVSLYIRYIEQARLQWTDSTYSTDKFMMKAMWRSKDKFYVVKPILQNLWLIEPKEKRDENWKIINHYIQVNFIIKGETTTVLENQSLAEPESGKSDTNTICTKYKCLYTKIKNISSKEETEQSSSITSDINNLINELKQECDSLWIAYDKTKERQFAKHILSAKEYGSFCEKIWMWRVEFASSILKASVLINYWKWACAWPMRIYQNYSEVYNKTKELHTKNQKNLIQSF